MSPFECTSANQRDYHILERGYCCHGPDGGTAAVVSL